MKYSIINTFLIIGISLTAIFFLAVSASWATPEYAERTAQGCKICHVNEEGGDLATQGLEFAASGYVWPPKGGYKILGPIRKSIRLIIGFLHITAAFMWFGTILYVHIMLRPKYADRGLPRGEVALGMVSMVIVGLTGVLLTVSKIRGLDVLYSSHWGIILSVKIILYITMISSAVFVIFFVGPKLKQGRKKAEHPHTGVFDPITLSGFDGKEGRTAYIAYKEKVYDVTSLKLWKNGTHVKHQSGQDMTAVLAKAPHGEEKLDNLRVVGTYDAGLTPSKSPAQKAFYFVAYMNLALVFCVLFVIAMLRWGIY